VKKTARCSRPEGGKENRRKMGIQPRKRAALARVSKEEEKAHVGAGR